MIEFQPIIFVSQNLAEGDGDWGVTPFQLWGFLSIKSSLLKLKKKKKKWKKKKLTSSLST